LLAAGNHTGCETIEVYKKAGADYRKKYQVDENIFTACRIVASAYRKADVTSTTIEGKRMVYKKNICYQFTFFIFQRIYSSYR
jgi:hypothetical protein